MFQNCKKKKRVAYRAPVRCRAGSCANDEIVCLKNVRHVVRAIAFVCFKLKGITTYRTTFVTLTTLEYICKNHDDKSGSSN